MKNFQGSCSENVVHGSHRWFRNIWYLVIIQLSRTSPGKISLSLCGGSPGIGAFTYICFLDKMTFEKCRRNAVTFFNQRLERLYKHKALPYMLTFSLIHSHHIWSTKHCQEWSMNTEPGLSPDTTRCGPTSDPSCFLFRDTGICGGFSMIWFDTSIKKIGFP